MTEELRGGSDSGGASDYCFDDRFISDIESASESFVMLDKGDLPGMARFCKQMQGIAESIADPSTECADIAVTCALAATRMAGLVEAIIMGASDQPDADMELVAGSLDALQSTICNGRKTPFPEALGVESDDNASPDTAENADATDTADTNGSSDSPDDTGSTMSIVDDEIFSAFIIQQQTVLPELDEAILAFEKDGSPNHIATIRRILHTMKGEAGVCGVDNIATLCHKTEDYIEDAARTPAGDVDPEAIPSTDILFEVKDWLVKAVDTYENGGTQSPMDELCSKLVKVDSAPSVPEEPPAADAAEPTPDDQEPGSANRKSVPQEAGESRITEVEVTDPELTADFVAEAQEHFDTADENLIILEGEPGNEEAIGAVFRAFHTIKGVSGFIGLTPIGRLAHVAETLLDEVRKGKKTFAGSVVDVTFAALDMLKLMIEDLGIALTSDNILRPRPELPAVVSDIEAVLAGEQPSTPPQATPPAAPTDAPADIPADIPAESEKKQAETAAPKPARTANRTIPTSQVMKVDAAKIDVLLDAIGELVIAESIVAGAREIRELGSQRLEKNLSHLGKITRSLQDMGMSMRMVPIKPTFGKMARLVRDLAKKSGKRVEFSTQGQETEIDKGMIERLGDPLVHMVRNSVDHGLESEEERRSQGKNPTGNVALHAFQKGGAIHIQIIDDGRGLDRDAIAAKAVERKVISDPDSMSDSEIFSLIFEAGFSTAKKVTEVSGRGVGMDVVRRNIEALRGTILIESSPGKGTTFTIMLPLTMAIIDGMQVRVGSQTYIIPTLSIIESFRPSPDMLTTIKGSATTASFRGRLLPLFRLSDILGIPSDVTDVCDGILIVVEDAGKQTGILVDEILGQQQTVIKSLNQAMGQLDGLAGASILADGRPGLILDVNGVVKLAAA